MDRWVEQLGDNPGAVLVDATADIQLKPIEFTPAWIEPEGANIALKTFVHERKRGSAFFPIRRFRPLPGCGGIAAGPVAAAETKSG